MTIPAKGIYKSSLTKKVNSQQTDSGHEIIKVFKTYGKKGKAPSLWYQKSYKEAEVILGELEAAMAEICRTLLGPGLVPKVRPIYDEKDQLCGSISKEIADFRSLVTLLENCKTAEQYQKALGQTEGLAKILLVRWWAADDDAHRKNIGTACIDFDMFMYPVTYQYKGVRTFSGLPISKEPSSCFPITQQDYKAFPHLHDAWMFYWPTNVFSLSHNFPLKSTASANINSIIENKQMIKEQQYNTKEKEAFIALAKNKRFIYQKNFCALKICLLPPQHFKDCIEAYMSHGDLKITLEQSFLERQQLLRTMLLETDEFKQFITEHGQEAITQILEEFSQYSATLKSQPRGETTPEQRLTEKYRCNQTLHIDATAVLSRYLLLTRDIQQHSLAWALQHLHDLWHKQSVENTESGQQLALLYKQLSAQAYTFFSKKNVSLEEIVAFGGQQGAMTALSTLALSDGRAEKRWQEVKKQLNDVYDSMANCTAVTVSSHYARSSSANSHSSETNSSSAIEKASKQPSAEMSPKRYSSGHDSDYYISSPQKIQELLSDSRQYFAQWLMNENNAACLQAAVTYAEENYQGEGSAQTGSVSGWLYSAASSYAGYPTSRKKELNQLAATKQTGNPTQLLEGILHLCQTGDWHKDSLNTLLMQALYQSFSQHYNKLPPIERQNKSPALYKFFYFEQKKSTGIKATELLQHFNQFLSLGYNELKNKTSLSYKN